MNQIHALFGATTDNLEEVRRAVETALCCALEERESTYHGGTYYRTELATKETIVVKRNADPFDGEPVERGFPQFPVLVYVDNTPRFVDLQKAFAGIKPALSLLRSRPARR